MTDVTKVVRLYFRLYKNHRAVPSLNLWLSCYSWQSAENVQYKINTLCYKCITCTSPSYICDNPQLYTLSRTLRSASDTLSPQVPRTRLSTVDSGTFSVFGPSKWNGLPLPLRQKPPLGLLPIKNQDNHFYKAIDLLCCPLRAAVFLYVL